MKGAIKNIFLLFDNDGRLMESLHHHRQHREQAAGRNPAGQWKACRAYAWPTQCSSGSRTAKTSRIISPSWHVVFQKDLGSMRESPARVATWLLHVADKIGGDPALALRASELSRCDLMTDMVFEFPEMQGSWAGTRHCGMANRPNSAQAMDEFYMPRFRVTGSTGLAPASRYRWPAGHLVGIFGIGMKPTGDKDPFALRRSALGALRILRGMRCRLTSRHCSAGWRRSCRTG